MRKEEGFSLIETIFALAILGIIAAAIFSGLGTASKATILTDERETARNLAASQMENVKKQDYSFLRFYEAPISSDYADAGYTVEIFADPIPSRDENIQKIRIVVSHQGKPIILAAGSTLEGYKVKR